MTPLDYDHSVFINCPFDNDYQPMFYALIFAVHDCGFVARSALENNDAGLVRIEGLYDLIRECRFGIHDISRTESDPDNKLPRFNMPLELGIFLAATKFGSAKQKQKRALVLERDRFLYQKYISDIAGQDIKAHGGKAKAVIPLVRDWLDSSPVDPEIMKPGARRMTERYMQFNDQLPELCAEVHLHPDELTFRNFRTLLEEWLEYNKW